MEMRDIAREIRELDRPARTVEYARWGRPVTMRAISAPAFAELADQFDEPQGAQAIEFSARILAATVTDPQLTVAEWLEMAHGTLVDLGKLALEINGLTDAMRGK